jgi:hypothetical protein
MLDKLIHDLLVECIHRGGHEDAACMLADIVVEVDGDTVRTKDGTLWKVTARPL